MTQLVGGGHKAGSDAGVNQSGTPGLAAMTGVCRVVHKRSPVVVVVGDAVILVVLFPPQVISVVAGPTWARVRPLGQSSMTQT